jgi:hypothetical protein
MCKGIVGLSSELPLLHVVVSAALVIVRCSLAAETNSGGYFIVGLISLANALDEQDMILLDVPWSRFLIKYIGNVGIVLGLETSTVVIG